MLCVYNKCRIVVDQIRNSLTGRCVLRTGKIGLLQLNSVHPVVKLTSSAETDTSEQTKRMFASLQTTMSIQVLNPSTPHHMIHDLVSNGLIETGSHYVLTAAGQKMLITQHAQQRELLAKEEARRKKENEQRLHKQYSELAQHTGLRPDTIQILIEGTFGTDYRTNTPILWIPEDQTETDELALYGTVKLLYDGYESRFVCHMTPEMNAVVSDLKTAIIQNGPLRIPPQIKAALTTARNVTMSDPWAEFKRMFGTP